MEKDFLWIRQCILSCTNRFQLDCCYKLVELFLEKNIDEPKVKQDYSDLLTTLTNKETLLSIDV